MNCYFCNSVLFEKIIHKKIIINDKSFVFNDFRIFHCIKCNENFILKKDNDIFNSRINYLKKMVSQNEK